MLPEPEPTAPTSTTIYNIQTAIHNSLPILEEVISLTEKTEEERIKKEVDKRRMRLGSGRPEQIKKEVSKEVWENSNVSEVIHISRDAKPFLPASFPLRRATESPERRR